MKNQNNYYKYVLGVICLLLLLAVTMFTVLDNSTLPPPLPTDYSYKLIIVDDTIKVMDNNNLIYSEVIDYNNPTKLSKAIIEDNY